MFVAEYDPFCALQAAMESVVLESDIFVSSTGNFNFSMKEWRNKAFVGNTGHLDNEIDWADSEGLEGVKVGSIKPQGDRFVFPVGHGASFRPTRTTSEDCFVFLVCRKSSMRK